MTEFADLPEGAQAAWRAFSLRADGVVVSGVTFSVDEDSTTRALCMCRLAHSTMLIPTEVVIGPDGFMRVTPARRSDEPPFIGDGRAAGIGRWGGCR